MNSPQTKLIIILAGLLLAAVVVSLLVLWGLPSGDEAVPTVSDEVVGVEEAASLPAPTVGFNLKVLQTAGYVALDKQPIIEKALPVQPPAVTGKANPFL